MKPLASYFGNRFAAVPAKKSKTARKAASEMEALESRLLLSGITAGSKVLKSYNFVDADGDKVSIKLTGSVAKGAGFQVDGLGNGFDVNEINLVGDLSKSNLVVSVKPVKLAPSDRTTANQLFSPGYTNIGSITADSQATINGTATGATNLRNVGLNAAIVGSIDLGNTDIAGGITLGVGRTAFVDRINTASPTTPGSESSYNPSAGLIDFHDITVASVGRITINGIIAATENNNANPLPSASPTNDFLGNITVTGGTDSLNANLGGIIGVRSVLYSNVNVAGNMGNVIVGDFQGSITTGGNLSISLPAGSGGTINAGGHVNLAFQPANAGAGVTTTAITAGGGISGFQSSLTDTITVPGGANAYINTLTNLSTTVGVANINVIGGSSQFSVNSASSIGNITASSFTAGFFTAGAGSIGNISASAGGIGVNFVSGGGIGNVSATGGDITGDFTANNNILNVSVTSGELSGDLTAGGSIGDVTVTNQTGKGINGSTIEAGSSIGAISVDITGITGLEAIDGATIEAGTTIKSLTVVSSSAAKDGIFNATINAGDGFLGNISVDVNTSSAAITGSSKFAADNDADNTGSFQNIIVENSGTGTGIVGGSFIGAGIGNITVNMNGTDGGDAISGGATFTAQTNTETAPGSNVFNNFGKIGNIAITNTTVTGNGGGIVGASFNAGGAGGALAIGNIQVTIANASANGGGGIAATINAANTSAGGNDTIFDSTIGTITVTNTTQGSGITANIIANAGIGVIQVTADGAAPAVNGILINADADGDLAGDISAITVNVTGIDGSGISSGIISGANVAAIQVLFPNSTSLGSTAGNGIAGDLSITATNGNIGNITVGALTNRAGGSGITGTFGATYSATGNIGAIEVFANTGDGINGLTVTADSDADNVGIVTSILANTNGVLGGTGDALDTVAVTGENIGAITATVIGGTNIGNDAITTSTFTAVGSIGTITANSGSSVGNGIAGGTITAGGALDSIQVVASNSSNAGSSATISVGSITNTSNIAGDVTGSITSTTGNIAQINVTASGAALGAVTNTVTSFGTLAITAADSITGLVTVGGTSTITAGVNIGNVISTATASSTITLDTAATTGTIGNVTSTGATALGTLTLTVVDAVSIGNIDVQNATLATDRNLTITNGAALASIGNITVDGALALGNSLSAVSTLGNVSVGSLATRTSHVEIGAAPVAVGSTVGTITITTGDLAILAGGLLANTQYQFNFDTYAANPVVTAGGGAVTPTASGAWAVGVGTGSNAAGGVAFITV